MAIGARGVTANWAVTESAGLRARVVITEGEQTFLRTGGLEMASAHKNLLGPKGRGRIE